MVMHSSGFDPGLLFRRILVPIDYSSESRHALQTAWELRRLHNGEIHAFVTTDFGQTSGLRGLGVVWGRQDVTEHARERLHRFAEDACGGGTAITDDALFGTDVVRGITQAAEDCEATVVILAVHQHNRFFRSRAEKIVHNLGIPVLVLQGAESAAEPGIDEMVAGDIGAELL